MSDMPPFVTRPRLPRLREGRQGRGDAEFLRPPSVIPAGAKRRAGTLCGLAEPLCAGPRQYMTFPERLMTEHDIP